MPVLTETNNYGFILKTILSLPAVSFLTSEAGILTNAFGHVTFLPNLLGSGADAVPFFVYGKTNFDPTSGTVVIDIFLNRYEASIPFAHSILDQALTTMCN